VKITVSTLIGRPVAGVWRWYAVEHVRNHPRWDPDMELEQISDSPIGLGTRIRRRNRHFGEPIEGEMEIVEWEPERAMGVQIHDANTDTRGRVTFEALGPSRTRLTIEADFPNLDASKVDQLRPLIERTASNVRRLVESEVQPGAGSERR
jgi:polyketide cyclase/dehydrase/lipid transport protein